MFLEFWFGAEASLKLLMTVPDTTAMEYFMIFSLMFFPKISSLMWCNTITYCCYFSLLTSFANFRTPSYKSELRRCRHLADQRLAVAENRYNFLIRTKWKKIVKGKEDCKISTPSFALFIILLVFDSQNLHDSQSVL